MNRHLEGEGGAYRIRNQEDWAHYMLAENEDTIGLRFDVKYRLRPAVEQFIDKIQVGRTAMIDIRFDAFLSNGEKINGYNFLHGTNPDVGAFEITGKALYRKGGRRFHTRCHRIEFDLTSQLTPEPEAPASKRHSRRIHLYAMRTGNMIDIWIRLQYCGATLAQVFSGTDESHVPESLLSRWH